MLGEIVQEALNRRGFRKISDAAAATGIDREQLNRILNRPDYNPGLRTLWKLTFWLGIEPKQLIECGELLPDRPKFKRRTTAARE